MFSMFSMFFYVFHVFYVLIYVLCLKHVFIIIYNISVCRIKQTCSKNDTHYAKEFHQWNIKTINQNSCVRFEPIIKKACVTGAPAYFKNRCVISATIILHLRCDLMRIICQLLFTDVHGCNNNITPSKWSVAQKQHNTK